MLPAFPSTMAAEIAEIPAAAQRLIDGGVDKIATAARRCDPPVVLTVARGSSDHAATVIKYAIEVALGLPVASIGPSVVSIYHADMRVAGALALVISQSGASVDLLETAQALRRNGALVVAITNVSDSPLAQAADLVLDIRAGPERAVAATKSFVNSVLAGYALVAGWAGDEVLGRALHNAPALLDRAMLKGNPDLGLTRDDHRAMVIGRGPGWGIAQEMALKLIELCAIQAAAYSAAEMLHGPRRLVAAGYPVIAVDAGAQGGADAAHDALRAQGARVISAPRAKDAGHWLIEPLLAMPWFYSGVESLARSQGFDPDAPPHLKKETITR